VTLDEFLASVETRSASVAGQQASAWHAVGLTIRRLGGVSAFFQSAVAPSGTQAGSGRLKLSQIAAALVEHGCGLDSAQEALVLDALCDKLGETHSGRSSSSSGSTDSLSVSPRHFSTVLEANTTLAQGSLRSPAGAAHAAQEQATHGGRAGASAGPPPGMAAQTAAAAQRLEQLPGLGRAGSAHAACASAWTKILTYLASEPSFAATVEDKFNQAASSGSNALDILALALCFKAKGLALARNELAAFYADSDVNSNGSINLEEFLLVVQRHRELRYGSST